MKINHTFHPESRTLTVDVLVKEGLPDAHWVQENLSAEDSERFIRSVNAVFRQHFHNRNSKEASDA